MGKLNWYMKNKDGLKLVEPNESIGKGYLEMAQDFFGTMFREKDKNIRARVSAGYYSIYY
mgnify:CR=1 FL=1